MERTKKFQIGEKTFTVDFPTIGQMIDMESLKQAYTNGRYGAMAQSPVVSMYRALDLVDAIAFYTICVPSVGKYYDISDYSALAMDKMMELVNIYKKELRPWYDGILNEMTKMSNGNEDGNAETKE